MKRWDAGHHVNARDRKRPRESASLLVIRFCWFAARSRFHWRASQWEYDVQKGADMEAMIHFQTERMQTANQRSSRATMQRQRQRQHQHHINVRQNRNEALTHTLTEAFQWMSAWDLIWSLHLNFNSIYIISALVGDCLPLTLLVGTTSGNNCIILWLNLIFSFFRSLKCENESAVLTPIDAFSLSFSLSFSHSHCHRAHS